MSFPLIELMYRQIIINPIETEYPRYSADLELLTLKDQHFNVKSSLVKLDKL